MSPSNGGCLENHYLARNLQATIILWLLLTRTYLLKNMKETKYLVFNITRKIMSKYFYFTSEILVPEYCCLLKKIYRVILPQSSQFIILNYLLTELSPSWEGDNCAAIQEIPSNFKVPDASSSCSQEPSNGPYPEPVRSSPYHPILYVQNPF
jgi:hypothetical protein